MKFTYKMFFRSINIFTNKQAFDENLNLTIIIFRINGYKNYSTLKLIRKKLSKTLRNVNTIDNKTELKNHKTRFNTIS